ncbi:hypothetical protein COCON_G00229210 [Conger conger]|uniref:Uncharacterized protein n=1 Tax=Conger conger TaxID=82655 RepID=A0A9Q1HJC8_CONCO|nr:hypothetical protein COCON_G00229210 [Conger conger]
MLGCAAGPTAGQQTAQTAGVQSDGRQARAVAGSPHPRQEVDAERAILPGYLASLLWFCQHQCRSWGTAGTSLAEEVSHCNACTPQPS